MSFKVVAVLAAFLLVGCSESNTTSDVEKPPTIPEFDLDKAIFLHADVSGWPVSNTLSVELGGGVICMNVPGRENWPTVEIPHHSGTKMVDVNANSWIFAYHYGAWYGSTWEWWGPTSTCKPSHEMYPRKQSPLNTWYPESGEVFYVMMSGLARGQERNINQRTNIVKIVWP